MTLPPSLQGAEERLQHALELSFRHLGRRERTVLEVRRHLEAKRVEPGTIAEALADLARQGYLDDERYARTFAEDRRALDGWGVERIERRLRAVGVEPHVIARALADYGPEGELAAALAVLDRRLAQAPRDDRGRERALALLVRRGYALETAYDAVRAFAAGDRDAAAGAG